MEIIGGTPEQMRQVMQVDFKQWGDLIKATGEPLHSESMTTRRAPDRSRTQGVDHAQPCRFESSRGQQARQIRDHSL